MHQVSVHPRQTITHLLVKIVPDISLPEATHIIEASSWPAGRIQQVQAAPARQEQLWGEAAADR
eukprot:scaffold236387_cov17-Tisochrysis_lutea.AAC.1